jgi:hypothetical protein
MEATSQNGATSKLLLALQQEKPNPNRFVFFHQELKAP